MARSFMARGLRSYTSAASTNISEMSFSTSARMMRALRSRSAWASFDSASCSSLGIMMSRISTDMTVTPHCSHFLPNISSRSRSICLRRIDMSARLSWPITSRMAVWAERSTAFG